MKIVNYIKYCLLLSVVFSLNSCLWDDKDTFDQSSAQRLNEAIRNSKEVLEAAPNGWLMEYFATTESGGYSLLVKFNTDGTATFGARNEYFPSFETNFGTYDVIGDSGPVISFNTFNSIIHMFSNPENPDGLGKEGDYEFIIMKIEDDQIILKGKKRETAIVLRKLSSDEDWKLYSDNLYKMDTHLFDSKVSRLSFSLGDIEYTAFNTLTEDFGVPSHVFSLLLKGDDEIVGDRTDVPFIVTPTGIRLYKPLGAKINGETVLVQHFNLVSERGALVSTESDKVFITGPSIVPFFTDSLNWVNYKWKMDKDNLGGEFATVYNRIVASCKIVYKDDFDSFFFTYKTTLKGKTLSFKSGTKYEGALGFSVSGTENGNLVDFDATGAADRNGTLYLNNIDGFKEMINLITQSSFTVTADSPIRPTVLRFTSKTNANDWFKVFLTK